MVPVGEQERGKMGVKLSAKEDEGGLQAPDRNTPEDSE